MSEVITKVILASASQSRQVILTGAGVSYTSELSGIDETRLKRSIKSKGASVSEMTETLARTKAHRVSSYHAGALIIGADQILECCGVLYDKPNSWDQARADLCELRGQTHFLHTSVCVVRDEKLLWHHTDITKMEMREFSDQFVDSYLAMAGDAVHESVGAYYLEGLGAQLFVRVEGDYFAVLGLPLLPLLQCLRDNGVLPR